MAYRAFRGGYELGRKVAEEDSIPAIFSDGASGATAAETAEYIHDILASLHGLARQPRNQVLRAALLIARQEAKRVLDEETRSRPSSRSWKKSTSGERPSC